MPTITVTGMSCEHCRKAVTEAVSKVPGVTGVVVDLAGGSASWKDADPAKPASVEDVKKAVTAIGFGAE